VFYRRAPFFGQYCVRRLSDIVRTQNDALNCALRAALWLIKLCHDRTRRDSRKENTLCYRMLIQAKVFFLVKVRRQQLFTMKRLFVFLNS
jgi:hypothetical protein